LKRESPCKSPQQKEERISSSEVQVKPSRASRNRALPPEEEEPIKSQPVPPVQPVAKRAKSATNKDADEDTEVLQKRGSRKRSNDVVVAEPSAKITATSESVASASKRSKVSSSSDYVAHALTSPGKFVALIYKKSVLGVEIGFKVAHSYIVF
jgi:hypothetical protein